MRGKPHFRFRISLPQGGAERKAGMERVLTQKVPQASCGTYGSVLIPVVPGVLHVVVVVEQLQHLLHLLR